MLASCECRSSMVGSLHQCRGARASMERTASPCSKVQLLPPAPSCRSHRGLEPVPGGPDRFAPVERFLCSWIERMAERLKLRSCSAIGGGGAGRAYRSPNAGRETARTGIRGTVPRRTACGCGEATMIAVPMCGITAPAHLRPSSALPGISPGNRPGTGQVPRISLSARGSRSLRSPCCRTSSAMNWPVRPRASSTA